VQNLDLTADVEVPYDVDAIFGFADLSDVGEAAAVVLTEAGHAGATYELASRLASTAEVAAVAGRGAVRADARVDHPWLRAMFDYYDRYGLPVGTRTLEMLLGRAGAANRGDSHR
jgi:hypothetical protein